ncbi:MAG TPA: Ni/Fe-hydrogenase cytochrome b subunit [Anaerovibrio sp.]|uniref:NrfD/PsrC family molybdoenzyme membrane anchor subunit n=1 Tax=Anaerovibrio lipolyticus TaxID=82374 RepID=UPI000E9EF01B|nr:Ni/Fe-hydrogenase cytochrome b subunit [Anaerovibrio lipolyticus]MBE6105866.1 Ni/Fe-hydrogenase cytochrome b subunit [Anaerovibrio lipolyticus]HAF31814.1 Ni/Fe-hydrogenase cytochrome b subunit [Anaerovibrio sp.]HAQ55388.1 Ni/Fe-hydrogenase cytochrome b subunit [Anaerovibrio sp.]HCP95588.1 Ni/Fe-hydrogenase cytochrome b subunit [Anaerovibrio sp.]
MKVYKCFRILGWDFTITPVRFVLTGLVALMVATVVLRLLTGFQYVTNLTDETPWGMWIAFDVMCGVALAGGGYSTALLVSIFQYKEFHIVARGALLTSLLGYILVMAGLFLDIGQWFNFWRPFVSWGYTSVLFEVFWCISIYTTVLSIEFFEIITERILRKKLHRYIVKILPVLIVIGLIFPVMHQSSLGGLFLIMKERMFPLWWSEFLPLYFLLSSFFIGSAMVTIETTLAKTAYGHEIPHNIMLKLTRVGAGMMFVYLLLKLYDLFEKHEWNYVFQGTLQSNMYCVEMLFGILIPLMIIVSPLSKKRGGLLTYAVLTVLGVILNRLNCVFTSMYESGSYFPGIGEIIVSVGLISLGVLIYCFLVENFNILGNERAVQIKIDKDKDIKNLIWALLRTKRR